MKEFNPIISDRKGNMVMRIFDNTDPKLKNYALFEDRWTSKHDEALYNENGEKFSIIDCVEYTDRTYLSDTLSWKYQTYSCVKFNKNVKVGDIFYTYI